ncbi:syntaxin [Pyrrhoderma noxium]|uniref:Syntaxin n=1 Tax=Pyrrhoderma noxium TaxID=2282107 RepID=A0A286UC30_9AGAM|nr:syntaxin [Pyrrhoderma noxium]
MARDRLAALKETSSSSYTALASQYELSQMDTGERTGMLDDEFYNEIGDLQDAIRKFNANIDELSKLHSSQIDSVDVGGSNLTRQIDGLIEETRGLMGNIKKRIQSLQSQRVDARAANMRRPQLELIRSKFMDAIQKYQTEEKAYRDKTKDRIARQYMIVNPNATQEEVDAVVSSDEGMQIFAQATLNGRYAEGQKVYSAVKDRHDEIKRIEKTLVELAQLFTDISLLVEQQGDIIDNIEEKTGLAELDIEAGKISTEKAVVSARGYRRKRWICLGITIAVIIVIAIILAIKFAPSGGGSSSNNNNNENNNSTSSS